MPALISLAFRPPATSHSLTTAAPRRRRRSILVFFRGSADLHEPMAQADWLRARLLATLRFKNDSDCRRGWLAPPQCQIHGLDVYISEQPASAREYVREMRDSIFCLAPPGYALWTYRFFEAISSGCIPVLFDERTQRLPFEGSDCVRLVRRSHRSLGRAADARHSRRDPDAQRRGHAAAHAPSREASALLGAAMECARRHGVRARARRRRAALRAAAPLGSSCRTRESASADLRPGPVRCVGAGFPASLSENRLPSAPEAEASALALQTRLACH